MSMEQALELSPCPFCGGEAEMNRRGDRRQSTIYSCTECGATLETGETFNFGAAWNARALTSSDDVETRARELLAAACGLPVESNTHLSLVDRDMVSTDRAIQAIVAALTARNNG